MRCRMACAITSRLPKMATRRRARVTGPVATGIFAVGQILFDHVHQKVGGRNMFRGCGGLGGGGGRAWGLAHDGVAERKILRCILPDRAVSEPLRPLKYGL